MDYLRKKFQRLRAQNINDKKQIKLGYERVKQKVKDTRQEYRTAGTEGRKSCSRKLVANSWDLLKKILGVTSY